MATLHSALYGLVPRRERLVAGARGTVLELGGGLNIPHYRNVDRVVVAEPDASRRTALLDRVASAAVPVEVHESALADSALRGDSFDTVVCTFALCAADDPAGTLGLIRRVLRPGGRLLFLEHVRGAGLRGTMQHVAGHVWRRIFDGCRPDLDTVALIHDAGFKVSDLERFSIRLAPPAVRSAVYGVAR